MRHPWFAGRVAGTLVRALEHASSQAQSVDKWGGNEAGEGSSGTGELRLPGPKFGQLIALMVMPESKLLVVCAAACAFLQVWSSER